MVRGAGSERGFGERPKPDDTAGEGPALLHQTPAPQPPLGHERPIYPHDLCGGLIPTLLCRGPVVARRWGPFLPPASLPLCARIKGTDERSSASKAQHVPCKSDTRLCLSPCPQWATTEHAPTAPPEKARAQHSETLTSCPSKETRLHVAEKPQDAHVECGGQSASSQGPVTECCLAALSQGGWGPGTPLSPARQQKCHDRGVQSPSLPEKMKLKHKLGGRGGSPAWLCG